MKTFDQYFGVTLDNKPLGLSYTFTFGNSEFKKLLNRISMGETILNTAQAKKDMQQLKFNIKKHFMQTRLEYSEWGKEPPKDSNSDEPALRSLTGVTPFPQNNAKHTHDSATFNSVQSRLEEKNNYKSVVFTLAYGNSRAWYVKIMEAQKPTVIKAKNYPNMLIYLDYEDRFIKTKVVTIPNRPVLKTEYNYWGNKRFSEEVKKIIMKNSGMNI